MGSRDTAQLDIKVTGWEAVERLNKSFEQALGGQRITAFNTSLIATDVLVGRLAQGANLFAQGLQAVVTRAVQMERANMTWKAFLGTAEAAFTRVEELRVMGARTPFEFKDLNIAALQLQAIGRYSERALQAIGNTAAAFGRTFEEAAQATLGVTRGELDPLERLGINKAEIARELGVALKDVGFQTQADIERNWDAVLRIMERKYDGMMDNIMKTTSGKWSNVMDAWNVGLTQMGEGMLPAANTGLDATLDRLQDMLDRGVFREAGEQLGGALAKVLDFAGKVGAAGGAAGGAVQQHVQGHSGYYEFVDAGVQKTLRDIGWLKKQWDNAAGVMGETMYVDALSRLLSAVGAYVAGEPLAPTPSGFGPQLPHAPNYEAMPQGVINAPRLTGGTPKINAKYNPADYMGAPYPSLPGEGDAGFTGPGQGGSPFERAFGGFAGMFETVKTGHQAMLDEMLMGADDFVNNYEATLRYSDSSTRVVYGGAQKFIQTTTQATGRVVQAVLMKENIDRLKGLEVVRYVVGQTASAIVSGISAEASAQAGKQIALAFGAYPDPAGMASHFKSAALWGLLGGVTAGIGGALGQGSQKDFDRNFGGGNNQITDDIAGTSSGGGGRGRSGGIRTLDAGVAPTTVHYTIVTNFYGPTVFGDTGMREFSQNLAPYIQDLLDAGTVRAA